MYEDYLQKALSNVVASRSAMYEYSKQPNSKLGKNMKNIAAYNIQQAIEHILKYLIYNDSKYSGGESSVRQILTHDIDRLIQRYCVPYNIKVPDKIVKNASIYTKWEAESRYSLQFSVRKDLIYTAIKETENWLMDLNARYKGVVTKYRMKYKES